jgi:hypothetical protein
MGPIRYLCVIALTSVCAFAQRQMTVAQLVSLVKSSIQQHNQDREVADYVGKLRLTNKLEERTVEELQGLGAGPRTVAALRKLSADTAGLAAAPPPPPKPEPVVIPPPDSIEQKKILDEIVDKALNYTENLPNFICTQVTRRRIDPSGTETWSLYDTVQEQLTFFDRKESYKVTMVNSRAVTNVDHTQLGGATSSGEFGTMQKEIFDPGTQTSFEWDHWATLRGHRMYVFSFKVLQENSKYSIYHQDSRRQIVSGYHGLIYADRETKRVMRIKVECDTIPVDFPIQQVSLDLNYDVTKIGDQEFLLPLKSDLHSRQGKFLNWNEVEFRLYRRFGTESSITFDTPTEPIPEDQLKEEPARPEPPPPVKHN